MDGSIDILTLTDRRKGSACNIPVRSKQSFCPREDGCETDNPDKFDAACNRWCEFISRIHIDCPRSLNIPSVYCSVCPLWHSPAAYLAFWLEDIYYMRLLVHTPPLLILTEKSWLKNPFVILNCTYTCTLFRLAVSSVAFLVRLDRLSMQAT